MKSLIVCLFLLLGLSVLRGAELTSAEMSERAVIQCGNLIYAGTRSSVCFADRFLTRVSTESNLDAAKKFTPVKLGSDDLFRFPFVVFSGEGDFTLTPEERKNLKRYLTQGGFILSSPGCSDRAFDKAFRRELATCLPDHALTPLDMSHEIFSIVYEITTLELMHGGTTKLEAVTVNGRVALVYSKDGLNDIQHAKGCCCCGGDEIVGCEKINVNIFVYALLY